MKRLFILHGYGATPQDHWFQALASRFSDDDVNVTIPEFPHPTTPRLVQWQATLRHHVGSVDENTFFIAHSLAGVNLLRYLNSAKIVESIGGIIFVAGFIKTLPKLPEINQFSIDEVARLPLRYVEVIASKDDTIVPYEYSKKLADNLDAKFTSYDTAGHFLASDGFTDFSDLYEKVRTMLK